MSNPRGDSQARILEYIEKTTRGFAGYFGKQAVINQAKDEDEALQAILASFNLYQ